MLIALAKDITIDLLSIDAANENRLELTEKLIKSVELQSDAKKYKRKHNHILSKRKLKTFN